MSAALPYRSILDSINPYVPGKRLEEVIRELGLTRVIKLASNENNLGCSPKVREAVASVLEAPYRYPDGGSGLLREELAARSGLTPRQLVIGAGSFELISFVAQAFIGPGDEAVMPHPSFSWYKTVTLLQDGRAIQVPLADHKIGLAGIKQRITDRTKVVWLCNPNNPTGTILTADELEAFMEDVPRNIIVVLDEAYCDFVTAARFPDTLSWINRFPNLVVLRTFSKIHGLAALRVGYAAASEEAAGAMSRVRQIFNVNAVAQAAAVASLRDAEFQHKVYENNRRGKEYLYAAFDRLGLAYIPTEASFVMVHVQEDSEAVFQRLLRQGVIVRQGTGYGMNEWLRVTIGTAEENRLFVEALAQVLGKVQESIEREEAR